MNTYRNISDPLCVYLQRFGENGFEQQKGGGRNGLEKTGDPARRYMENNKVKILCDSTCDLSPELIEKFDIDLMPMYVNLDGQMFRDGVDIHPEMIFDLYREKKILPKTAAPSVQDFIDFYDKYTSQGYDVVQITISSDFSSSYQNACIAAKEAEGNIYVVDSRNLSTGVGHVVLNAAEMRDQGMSAAQIKEKCDELVDLVDASFVISNVIFLYKGGRCSATAAVAATALNIKPSINVIGGKMDVGKKYRGSYEKCLMKYIRDRLENANDIDPRRLFITRSTESADIDKKVLEEVSKYVQFEEVNYTRAGCTVCGHCGPDTLGILYMHKRK